MIERENILIPYRIKNKWGFVNFNKQIIIPCIYKQVKNFNNGFAEVELGYQKIGIIDYNGKEFIPTIYKSISLEKGNEYFIVEDKKGKYGLYKNWDLVFECTYDFIIYKSDNIFLVNQNRRWKFINLDQIDLFPNVEIKSYNDPYHTRDYNKLINDNVIIYKYFEVNVYIDSIKKDLIYKIDHLNDLSTKNEKIYYFSRYVNWGREDRFDSLIFYNSNFDLIQKNDIGSGLKINEIVHSSDTDDFIIVEDFDYCSYVIDEKFNSVKKLNFRVLGRFRDDLAPAEMKIDGKIRKGFVNKQLEVIIPFSFDSTNWFKDGMCIVQKDGLFGIIDTYGNIIIPFLYKRIGEIHDGLVAVQFDDDLSNSCGFINLNNQLISKNDYAFYYGGPYFSKYGVAVVQRVGKGFGLINRSGIEFLECKYGIEGGYFNDGFIIFSQGGKKGIINYYGEVIIKPKYEKIYSQLKIGSIHFWYVVLEESVFGCIDEHGNEYWEGCFDFEKTYQ
jgi:hypothetical protein